MTPLVAIVGRPNVGKSTLFNRLIHSRKAIVQDDPGVTRDRHYGTTIIDDHEIQLVDTGGFVPEAQSGIDLLVREQAQIAVDEADVVLLVLDARQGATAQDAELVRLLRRSGKPVLHLANKVDSAKQELLTGELYELGVEQIIPISAEHALGLEFLADRLCELLPPMDPTIREASDGIRVALVGRPNAGKSSLFNALVGQDRMIVADEPGTTRDSVDLRLETPAGVFVLVDTAGIRRKKAKSTTMERFAILRAIRDVSHSDVACLVIDSELGPSDQDARVASMVEDAGRAMVLVLTKYDLLRGRDAFRQLDEQLEERLGFVSHAPMIKVSSVTRRGLKHVWPTVRQVHESWSRHIPTAELNRFLEQAVAAHAPPAHRGHPVRLYFVSQPQVKPPTFVVSTSNPAGITRSYRRFLANRLRAQFGFAGTPLRLLFRAHREVVERSTRKMKTGKKKSQKKTGRR